MPYRRDVVLFFASLAFAAAAVKSIVHAEVDQNQQQQQPTAAASASAGSGGGGSGGGVGGVGGAPLGLFFPPPWAKATAAVSSVTASAACSLFGRESSVAARDSRLGLVAAAACDVATNLELWLQPLLGATSGTTTTKKKKWFLPLGATPLSAPAGAGAAASDALAADRAAVASTATAAASTTSSSSSASSSATANARPVCAAASLFPGTESGISLAPGGSVVGGSNIGNDNRVLLPVCQGPSLEVVADGGRCAVESKPPHAVTCVSPSVTLEIAPPRCSLSYYSSDDGGGGGGGGDSSVLIPPPSRSLVVDAHCGPPFSSATGGGRVFLGGKLVPVAASLNGSSSDVSSSSPPSPSLAEFDRAASALSSWPEGWGGAPLADAKSLAELLAVALLPGRVTATASVVEEG